MTKLHSYTLMYFAGVEHENKAMLSLCNGLIDIGARCFISEKKEKQLFV